MRLFIRKQNRSLPRSSADLKRSNTAPAVSCDTHLQRTIGNYATVRMLKAPAHGVESNGAPPIVHEVLTSAGQPLDSETRDFMELRFGHAFSNVRVHSDAAAAQSARSVNAKAYTVGQNIVFGANRFAPDTREGRRLLAHELTHVVQQGAFPTGSDTLQRDPDDRHDKDWREAVVELKWKRDLDQGEFVDRLVPLVARKRAFRGLSRDHIRAALMVPGGKFFREHQLLFKTGQQVQLRISASFAEDMPRMWVEYEEPKPVAAPVKSKEPPAKAETESIPADETKEQRLERERGLVAKQLANYIVEGDRLGYISSTVTVHYDGRGLAHSADRKGVEAARPAGASLITFEEVRRTIYDLIGQRLNAGPGDLEIVYERDEPGKMVLKSFTYRKVNEPKLVTPSQRDEEAWLREEMRLYGIPDRKAIYSEIFKQAEKELKDAGVKLATFAIEQLVLWIAGGLLIKAIAKLAVVGAKSFPYLRRVASLGRKGDLAKAVNALGEAESKEFAALMDVFNTGKLDAAGLKRLNELMVKVESNVAGSVPALRVVGRMKEHDRLVKAAKNLSEAAQDEVDDLIARYLKGNTNPGIGTKHLAGDIYYLRGRNGGRVFYRESASGYMEILGKADKGNETAVINAVLQYFGP